MDGLADPSRRRRFGDFVVDIESGEVWRGDHCLVLQEQPRRILALMLARPGQIITREDLQKQIWGGDTFVDFEHGLNAAIKRLRDTLGDSADNPRFVETVPRRGYRFIAPVEPTSPQPAAGVEGNVASTGPSPRLAIGLVLATAALGGAVLWRPATAPNLKWGAAGVMTAIAVTPSAERNSRLSPDAQWVSFLSGQAGESRLWLRHRRETEARPVMTADGFISSHAWSPDGQSVAYVLDRGPLRMLHVVPALQGGVPREVTQLKGRARLVRWVGNALFVELAAGGLTRIDASSGVATDLASSWDAELRFKKQYDVSAVGDRAVFVARSGAQDDLWAIDLATGRTTRLTDDTFVEQYPVFGNAAGTSVFYQSSRSGQLDVWRLSTADGTTTQITVSAEDEIPEDASDQAQVLTFRRGAWIAELWSASPETSSAVRLTQGLWDFWPTVSADGRKVAFQRRKATMDSAYSYRETDLFVGARSAGGLDAAPAPVISGFVPKLSPNGRWLAYARPSQLPRAFTALLVTNLEKHTVTTVTERFAFPGLMERPLDVIAQGAVWAPDGRLYFVEWTPDNIAQIKRLDVTEATNRAEVIVTAPQPTDHLRDVFVSEDGRVLRYTRATLRGDVETHWVDLITRDDRVVWRDTPGSTGYFFVAGYSSDGRDAVILRGSSFHNDSSQPLDLLYVGLSGKPTPVATLERAFGQTARLLGGTVADGAVYVVMSDSDVHNIYAIRLANGAIRKVTDNGRVNLSYSGLLPFGSGELIFVRHEYIEDVWTLNLPAERP